MTEAHDTSHPSAHPGSATDPDAAPAAAEPTLAEDLLLLLFQPDSNTIAGEGTLFYTLAGAVLADLGLGEQVRLGTGLLGSTTVEAVGGRPPGDEFLRATWEYVADKPRGVQTVLAGTGTSLRGPLLDRLVERGDLDRRTRKTLGLFETTVLEEGRTGRREQLLADVRAVLVDGAEPDDRTAALAALVYGSGTLPQFDPEIPWNGPVVSRAEALKAGNWGASATAKAVTRTLMATIAGTIVAVTSTAPRE